MKSFMLIIITVLTALPLVADEIYFFDGSIKKGTVTDVKTDTIEYSDSAKSGKKIQRKTAEKIIYSNGMEVDFYDKIHMKNGFVEKGRIIKKNRDSIEYRPAGKKRGAIINKSEISKIVFDSGVIENFRSEAEGDFIHFKDGKVVRASEIVINNKDVEYRDENNRQQLYGKSMIEKITYDGKSYNINEPLIEIKKRDTSGEVIEKNIPSNMFAEFEFGWNGYAGLGVRMDSLFLDHFSINGAVGICSWGYRASAALRFYADYPFGFALSCGAAYSTGGKGKVSFAATDQTDGSTYNDNLDLNMKPVTCINASVLYSLNVGERDKLYIEAGYSYAMQKEKYTYSIESGRISEESNDITKAIGIFSPGGVMISAGYAVAF